MNKTAIEQILLQQKEIIKRMKPFIELRKKVKEIQKEKIILLTTKQPNVIINIYIQNQLTYIINVFNI